MNPRDNSETLTGLMLLMKEIKKEGTECKEIILEVNQKKAKAMENPTLSLKENNILEKP